MNWKKIGGVLLLLTGASLVRGRGAGDHWTPTDPPQLRRGGETHRAALDVLLSPAER